MLRPTTPKLPGRNGGVEVDWAAQNRRLEEQFLDPLSVIPNGDDGRNGGWAIG